MPHDFGKKLLVEECQIIELSALLETYRSQIKQAVISAEIQALGTPITLTTTKTPFGGTRLWFCCPNCGARAGKLIVHPQNLLLGCRTCFKIDYRKHRYRGMVEAQILE